MSNETAHILRLKPYSHIVINETILLRWSDKEDGYLFPNKGRKLHSILRRI